MVCSGAAVLGAIELRDIVKADIKSRFAELRATRLMGPVERGLYRITGVSADQEMGWKRYAIALLIFNLIGGRHNARCTRKMGKG